MYWIRVIQDAVNFIEDNLLENLSIEDIASHAHSSSANFQRIFSIITGMTAGDYVRCRRLSLAGKELAESDAKIVDIALKYGYETPKSFTKAFTRFHNVTPSAARRQDANRNPGSPLKIFLPFSINIDIRGGCNLRRKLISNVPVIAYDGNNAAFFITLLEAALHGIGEECDRPKLVALSGEGNRFCWTDSAWVVGNEVTQSINENPFDTESRVLNAIGWQARYVTVQRNASGRFMNTDPAQIRQDFIDAIDRGFPVLVQYIHHADCNRDLFFGYEDGGKKVIAYYYNNPKDGGGFQSDATPVVWDNWEENLVWYILLQNKNESSSPRETALSTFANISVHARKTEEIRGKKVGFSAWVSFLHHLEHDDFSDLPLSEVAERFGIYCDALCQIWGRNEALPYYRSLVEQFPEWRDDLLPAIDNWDACAAYAGFWLQQGFAFNDAGYEKFRTKEARKILADAGRDAMRKDIAAVEHIEKILRKEGRIR